jgi:hypothetical protein
MTTNTKCAIWITTITGVISCIIGVLTYFKKDKKGD